MAELVADCPRCGTSKITLDVLAATKIKQEYGWQYWYEIYCVCRNCRRSSIFVVSESVDANYKHVHEVGLLKVDKTLNNYINIEGIISVKDRATVAPPEYLPKEIEGVFKEAFMCLAIGCNNAAGTMFRLCLDLATRSLLPIDKKVELDEKTRRDLGRRLPWLIDNGYLAKELKRLSACVKEDGNDGAHAGTLTKAEAEDLLDFSTALLERIYTEPRRLKLAEERRAERRGKDKK